MGEGYVASWVSFGGILIGLLVSAFTWNWWWENQIENGARLWLPGGLGYGGAVALTLGALLAVYLALLWWESRGGLVIPDTAFKADDGATFAARLNNTLRRVFVHGWPAAVGGAALGGLNVLQYTAEHPWGFTGELSRWMVGATNTLGVAQANCLRGWSFPAARWSLAAAAVRTTTCFIWCGAWSSARSQRRCWPVSSNPPAAREAALRSVARRRRDHGRRDRYGLHHRRTFSQLFLAALNGWIFAVFSRSGAWLGTQVIQRIG
jgi:hypothetical protein